MSKKKHEDLVQKLKDLREELYSVETRRTELMEEIADTVEAIKTALKGG